MKRRIGLGILLVAAFLAGCTQKTQEKETILELQESVINAPQTVEVERGSLEVSMIRDAQIGPAVRQLTFKEQGYFAGFCVGLGQEVKAGDVIATSVSTAMEEDIEDKQREIENLTRDYEYQKAMLESNIALLNLQAEDLNSRIVFEEKGTYMYDMLSVQTGRCREERKRLELELRQAGETYALELSHLEKQLADLIEKKDGNVIKAPCDGVIVALAEASFGNEIDTDLYYAAIADTDLYYARCEYVNQTLIRSARKMVFWKDGKEYPISYVPIEEKVFLEMRNSGEILYSDFRIEDTEGEIEFGDCGKIKLITVQKQDVLLLPALAVGRDAEGSYVYLDVEGSRQRVNIETGSSDGIRVEILDGLQEGDVVYVPE